MWESLLFTFGLLAVAVWWLQRPVTRNAYGAPVADDLHVQAAADRYIDERAAWIANAELLFARDKQTAEAHSCAWFAFVEYCDSVDPAEWPAPELAYKHERVRDTLHAYERTKNRTST